MTEIYIVRHCETDGNATKTFQGHTDNDINLLGEKQLVALSERFKNINLETVFTSPLIRTRKTAKAIVGNRNIPIVPVKGLIELNGGVYEGKTYEEIGNEYPDFKLIWQSEPWRFSPPNGESMVNAYNRIWKTVFNIALENKNKTMAISTHGGVLRCLLCRILKNDIKKLTEIPFGLNTCVALIKFDDYMTADVIYFNDDSHLTDELKNTNAKVPVK